MLRQLLKALWGKIAGQAPPVPPAVQARQLPLTPLQGHASPQAAAPVLQPDVPPATLQEMAAAEDPRKEAFRSTSEPIPPKVELAPLGREAPTLQSAQAVYSPPGLPRFTSAAESIHSLWAKNDTGSRISRIASATDSGRAISSISMAAVRQLNAETDADDP